MRIIEIKIIKCEAFGPQFGNLTPNSIHKVITPPKGYKNYNKGVWVMGINEPVKVLSHEFIINKTK